MADLRADALIALTTALYGDDEHAQRVLSELESAGYRVVPAGLVPQFDDLSEVADILNRLGNWSNSVHNSQQAKTSAALIRQLRDLACLVLRVDQEAGQSSE